MDKKEDASTAVASLFGRVARAWARGDALAYGACFTVDCHYIAWFGGVYRGRGEVVASHRLLFDGPLKGTRLFSEVIDLRSPMPGLALLVTRGDVAARRPAKLRKVQSWMATAGADGWLFAHFHNSREQPLTRWLTYRAGPGAVPSLDLDPR